MIRIAAALCLVAAPVMAQEPPTEVPGCLPFKAQIAHFAQRWKVPTGAGIHLDGRLFTMLVNPETHTWSVLSTDTSGLTCLVAGGTEWSNWTVPVGEPT